MDRWENLRAVFRRDAKSAVTILDTWIGALRRASDSGTLQAVATLEGASFAATVSRTV